MQDRNVLLYEPIAARTGPEKPKQLTAASHTCQSGLYLTPPVRFAEVRPSNAPHCTGRESWHSKLRCCFFVFFFRGGVFFGSEGESWRGRGGWSCSGLWDTIPNHDEIQVFVFCLDLFALRLPVTQSMCKLTGYDVIALSRAYLGEIRVNKRREAGGVI